jgi:hypothetical protein
MAIGRRGFEARAHAGRQVGQAVCGMERRATLQDVDEFVLLGMRVAKG